MTNILYLEPSIWSIKSIRCPRKRVKYHKLESPDGSGVKNLPVMQETQEMWVQSLGQEVPLEEEIATTPVLLPEKFYSCLVGYSPWGHKELDTTEHAHARLTNWGNPL